MRFSTVTALLCALALSACGASADNKTESGLMTALRSAFAFRACTNKLEERFKLGDIRSVSIDDGDMDVVTVGRPGDWDVKFKARITERPSGRVSRYVGVCHVRRDRPTTLDAALLDEIRPAANDVRRIAP